MTSNSGNNHVKDQAGSEAQDLKNTVKGEAADLQGTAKQEAKQVAGEAKFQAKGMLDESVRELRTQASTGQNRLAEVVRSLANEAGEMAGASNQNGVVTKLASDASSVGGDVAQWLERREPEDILDEVGRFAARRPATFLAIAAGAGLLAGRFVRGMQSDAGTQPQLEGGRQFASQYDSSYAQRSLGAGSAQGQTYGEYGQGQYAPGQNADHAYSYSEDVQRVGEQPNQSGEWR